MKPLFSFQALYKNRWATWKQADMTKRFQRKNLVNATLRINKGLWLICIRNLFLLPFLMQSPLIPVFYYCIQGSQFSNPFQVEKWRPDCIQVNSRSCIEIPILRISDTVIMLKKHIATVYQPAVWNCAVKMHTVL